MTKPPKFKLNCLGVDLSFDLTRGEHYYEGAISKRKFNEVWNAALEAVASRSPPDRLTIEVHRRRENFGDYLPIIYDDKKVELRYLFYGRG